MLLNVLHVDGQDKNHVTLYDSLSPSIPLRTKEQIASLIFCDNKEISIDIPDVQEGATADYLPWHLQHHFVLTIVPLRSPTYSINFEII